VTGVSRCDGSGGKRDLSSTNPTSICLKQGESSSSEERSGMGPHGASEPWGRIPRSVGLTRGTAVPDPRSTEKVERTVCSFMLSPPDGLHRMRPSVAVVGGHALSSSGPGGG